MFLRHKQFYSTFGTIVVGIILFSMVLSGTANACGLILDAVPSVDAGEFTFTPFETGKKDKEHCCFKREIPDSICQFSDTYLKQKRLQKSSPQNYSFDTNIKPQLKVDVPLQSRILIQQNYVVTSLLTSLYSHKTQFLN